MFKKLPLLEELHLDYTPISTQAIEVAGRGCPRLKSFKLNNQPSKFNNVGLDEDALAIAKNMRGLRHLQLIGNSITIYGLLAIIAKCSHLESIDLSKCFNVADQLGSDLRKRLFQQIKDLRLPLNFTQDYGLGTAMHQWEDNLMFPAGFFDGIEEFDDYDLFAADNSFYFADNTREK